MTVGETAIALRGLEVTKNLLVSHLSHWELPQTTSPEKSRFNNYHIMIAESP